ncbi:MAG TPA: hypothetical protein VE910_06230 [Dongiaceae bacterium]|jgi:hypothetical protein|nr:hypothetical protein [Dongiaceae bacterium]
MTTHDPHAMAGDHPLPPDHPEQTKTIFIWGVATLVVLAIMLVWLRSYFFLVRNETIQKIYLSAPNPKIDELHAHEQQVLHSYGWVDRQKGIVHIPIDQAMELMVRESGHGVPQSAPATQGAPSSGAHGSGTHP